MRIATWNLERPSRTGWKIPPRQRARMAAIDADVWVLTETRASVAPSDDHHGLHTPPHPTRRADTDERWTSSWSRWPLEATAVPADPRGTVSAVVHAPAGPVVVYGTVIPWANDKGEDGTARMWEVHHREIERQGREWRQHPAAPLVVAGDFNQSRDSSGWYGTRQGRALLTDTMHAAGLECLTEADMVAVGELASAHLVDHVSAPPAGRRTKRPGSPAGSPTTTKASH